MRAGGAAALLAMGALLATGCAAAGVYTLVQPGPQTIAGAYTVQTGAAWSATAREAPRTWTIDGMSLQRLRFFGGIAEGQPLVEPPPLTQVLRAPTPVEDRRPRFRAALTPPEVPELVAESLFGSSFPARNVRPALFGDAPGFRFEVTYATSDGVSREALVAGAVVDGRLHVIVYDGSALHHFGKYREEAERIINSVRLLSTR